jgi:hypothetical protein
MTARLIILQLTKISRATMIILLVSWKMNLLLLLKKLRMSGDSLMLGQRLNRLLKWNFVSRQESIRAGIRLRQLMATSKIF